MDLDFSMPDHVINKKAKQLLFGYAPNHTYGAMAWGVSEDELANEVLFRIWKKRQAGMKVYFKYIVMKAAEALRMKAQRKGFKFLHSHDRAPKEFYGLTRSYEEWKESACSSL